MAQTDSLTGLYNRRLMDQRLAEWAVAQAAASIVMIDIDHFKSFNDALGHPAGDRCRERVAAVLLSLMPRETDGLAVQYGGEEFLVAMRTDDIRELTGIVEAILRSIESLAIEHPSRSDGLTVVTASAGLAIRQAGRPWSPPEIINAADEALYAAKQQGRNGYAVADPSSGH